MRRIIPAILLVAVLAIGGGLIANTAYQAGLSTAVTTVAPGATVVAPLPAYGYGYGVGYGWHPFGFGFGFFGFLGTLLFLFLVFGLIRAVFRGGPGRHGGWGPGRGGGPGAWGPGGHDHDRDHGRGGGFWESRFSESFEEWHRKAHGNESSSEPPTSNAGSKPA